MPHPSTSPDLSPSRRQFLSTTSAGLLIAGVSAIAKSSGANAVDLAPPDRQPPDLKVPTDEQKRVGFAIVGLGELALGQILPAFYSSQHCAAVALVSGHPDKAKAVARHYGINPMNIYSYDNYDTLKDN